MQNRVQGLVDNLGARLRLLWAQNKPRALLYAGIAFTVLVAWVIVLASLMANALGGAPKPAKRLAPTSLPAIVQTAPPTERALATATASQTPTAPPASATPSSVPATATASSVPPTATAAPATATVAPATATRPPEATPTRAPTVAPPTAQAACLYYASKNSEVFHKADCGEVKTIKAENLLCFKTRDAAVNLGRRPAKCCNP